MTVEQGLLQAVCDDPEDDVPRLVYADRLEETGDPEKSARADFFRTQIELARMPEEDEDVDMASRRVGLESRAARVVRAGGRMNAWFTAARRQHTGPAAEIKPARLAPGIFVRGFANFALAETERFLEVGEA